MPFANDEKRVLPANRKSQCINIVSAVASALLSLTDDDLGLIATAGASALFQNHQIADLIVFKRDWLELEVPVRNLELLQTLMRYPASDEPAITVGSWHARIFSSC
jgi:hypothetical protein